MSSQNKYNLKIHEGRYSERSNGIEYNYNGGDVEYMYKVYYEIEIIQKNGEKIRGELLVQTPALFDEFKEILYKNGGDLLEVAGEVEGRTEEFFDYDKTTFELPYYGQYYPVDEEFREISQKIDKLENYKPLTAKTFLKYFEIEDKMKDCFMFQNI